MKKYIKASLIYHLPILGNLFLSTLSYLFLSQEDAFTIVFSQFLSAAGLGVYSIVFGPLAIYASNQFKCLEGYLLRIFLSWLPIAFLGILFLVITRPKPIIWSSLILATGLTIIDAILLMTRSVKFTSVLSEKISGKYLLIFIGLIRLSVSISPIFGSYQFIFNLIVIYSVMIIFIIFFQLKYNKNYSDIKEEIKYFKEKNILSLLFAGYLNGIIPFLFMVAVEEYNQGDNLILDLIIFRLILIINMVSRFIIDVILVNKKFIFSEVALSLLAILVTVMVCIFNRSSWFIAVLPALSNIAKYRFNHNILDYGFHRNLLSPIVWIVIFLLAKLMVSIGESIALAYLISTVAHVYVMKNSISIWSKSFLTSLLCMIIIVYEA